MALKEADQLQVEVQFNHLFYKQISLAYLIIAKEDNLFLSMTIILARI